MSWKDQPLVFRHHKPDSVAGQIFAKYKDSLQGKSFFEIAVEFKCSVRLVRKVLYMHEENAERLKGKDGK